MRVFLVKLKKYKSILAKAKEKDESCLGNLKKVEIFLAKAK